MYSGSSSLERAGVHNIKGDTGEVGRFVEDLGYPVLHVEPVDSALADMDACARAYWGVLTETKMYHGIMGYYLVDISGDGVPELLVYDDDSHAGKVHIYSYADDKVTDIGSFGEYGSTYIDIGHHSICDQFFGQGSLSESFYDITDREAVLTGSVGQYERYDDEKEESYYIYDVDGNDVTEDEYDLARSRYDTGDYTAYGYDSYQMYGLE